MKVALFSTQHFERPFLLQANKKFRHELFFHNEALHQETAPMAHGFPAVSAFVNDKLDAATLSALVAGSARLVALRSAGYDNVDLPAADKLKITLRRVPAYAPAAIAEYAVALMLTLNRHIHQAYNRVLRAISISTIWSGSICQARQSASLAPAKSALRWRTS